MSEKDYQAVDSVDTIPTTDTRRYGRSIFRSPRKLVSIAAIAFLVYAFTLHSTIFRYIQPDSYAPWTDIADYDEVRYLGISLSLTHVTAVLIHQNNTHQDIVASVPTRDVYHDVLWQLSQPSSRHIRPPYYGNGLGSIEPAEQWRQLKRNVRKKLGRPATYEIGIIAEAIQPVFHELYKQMERPYSSNAALLVTPALMGFYDEDEEDLMNHMGYSQWKPQHGRQAHLFDMGCQGPYELQAAEAAAGMGICEHYQDREQCKKEMEAFPSKYTVGVQWTSRGMIVSRGEMFAAEIVDSYDGTMHSGFGGMELGSASPQKVYDEEAWWEMVMTRLQHQLVIPSRQNVSDIFLYGESFEGEDGERMERLVRAVLDPYQEEDIKVHREDPQYMVARGAAELVRRAAWWSRMMPWNDTEDYEPLERRNPDPLACPWTGESF